MKKILIWVMILASSCLMAQEALTYQKPPQEILELVDVERAPLVRINSNADTVLLLYRDSYKTLAELSEKEMRLAGLRINPTTNIGSRTTYYNNLKIMDMASGKVKKVKGLPEGLRLANLTWSNDEKHVAFTHTTESGVEAWVVDLKKHRAKKLTEANLNANMGNPLRWFKDNKSLLVKQLPANRLPLIDGDSAVPAGPTISVSDGAKAQNRTYQDLLKNNNDEHNFEQLALSELHRVTLKGKSSLWKAAAMYRDLSFSPDGQYISISTIHRPFSYIVPNRRFPTQTHVYNQAGDMIKMVNDVPLTEVIPKGFMSVRKGKRSMQWRPDKPATLYFVEALDEGDPAKEVSHRDVVKQWAAPFDQAPTELLKTKDRYYRVLWGDEERALVYDYWWNTRLLRTSLFNPSNASEAPLVVNERDFQNAYADPGQFVTKRNDLGRRVLDIQDDQVFLLGEGHSEAGQFPFVDVLNLESLVTNRLYQSDYQDKLETLSYATDMAKGEVLVRIESPTEYPNYYIRNVKQGGLKQVTHFANPFESLQNVHKEVVEYQREDGLPLTGTLYLPPGYDRDAKEKLPMILWAYPTEFKNKDAAGQNTKNPNEFTYPFYGSMLYWVTRGYAVLDDAAFPIVGEGDEEPNDTFVTQLVANGKAAIDAIDDMGYIDRHRVAVGGHSYGAFMTANLLTHSDLFAAGIARSGAYNRTLTPFGFQSEERSYWEADDVYNTMSPFMNADQMDQPLLLIHGEADNNSGTYPMQSERYFNALKGLGATARLVMLPKESHGYRAKESILHMLWEQDQWLEKYVKNKAEITE